MIKLWCIVMVPEQPMAMARMVMIIMTVGMAGMIMI